MNSDSWFLVVTDVLEYGDAKENNTPSGTSQRTIVMVEGLLWCVCVCVWGGGVIRWRDFYGVCVCGGGGGFKGAQ